MRSPVVGDESDGRERVLIGGACRTWHRLRAVIVFLNGSFGIGKSTVARHLRDRLPGSAIFDPELVGAVLWRLPGFVPLAGRGTDDYQDLPAWRRLSIRGIRLTRRRRDTVIVPMAFTNLAYLREFQEGARAADPDVRHFCLTAPYEVVRARLAPRAQASLGAVEDARGHDYLAARSSSFSVCELPSTLR